MTFDLLDYHIWLILLAAISATLAASSIYPALLLSSFEPLKALKGKISAGIGDVLFRKILGSNSVRIFDRPDHRNDDHHQPAEIYTEQRRRV